MARGNRCSAGRSAKMPASASGSKSASSCAVGSWPSRSASWYGELNAFSNGTCWSSIIASSSANPSRDSNSLACGSIGSDSVISSSRGIVLIISHQIWSQCSGGELPWS